MTTTHHPEHLLDRVAMATMRLMLGSMKGSVTGPEARGPFDELMEKVPPALRDNPIVGRNPAWLCYPSGAPEIVADAHSRFPNWIKYVFIRISRRRLLLYCSITRAMPVSRHGSAIRDRDALAHRADSG